MTTVSPGGAVGGGRRCAVIANPTKVSDRFRDVVEKTLQRDGWVDTLWLETAADDPGRAMTRRAVTEQVDLIGDRGRPPAGALRRDGTG